MSTMLSASSSFAPMIPDLFYISSLPTNVPGNAYRGGLHEIHEFLDGEAASVDATTVRLALAR
jgi:hypothetical protein